MNIVRRVWVRALESVIGLALGLLVREHRRFPQPQPIVWRDPRPYRSWTTENLKEKFAASQSCEVHPDDCEERTAQCALMLDEILIRHVSKSRLPHPGVHN